MQRLAPKMGWKIMDARDLSAFDEETFDLVIEKLTMDTILCGEEPDLNVSIMLHEC